MNPHEQNNPQGEPRYIRRVMRRAKRKMDPHMEKFSSPDGQYACVIISIAAAAVAGGLESKESLKSVTRLASEISGIPLGAMTAHADFALATMTGSMKAQQTSPTVGG